MTRVRLAVVFSSCLVVGACGGGSPTAPSTVNVSPPVTSNPPPTTIDGNTTPPPSGNLPTPPPVIGATSFLAFGDSITQGQSAVSRTMALVDIPSYPSHLQLLLSERYRAQTVVVTNEGRAGEWAQDGQFRLPLTIERTQPPPQALLLLEGVNDLNALGSSGISRAEAAIESMARTGRTRQLRVFIATLPPQRPGGARAGSADLVPELNRRIRTIARGEGAVLVDLEMIFGTNYDLLSEDGLHPNAEGYRVIANAFFDAIRADLERAAVPTSTLH